MQPEQWAPGPAQVEPNSTGQVRVCNISGRGAGITAVASRAAAAAAARRVSTPVARVACTPASSVCSDVTIEHVSLETCVHRLGRFVVRRCSITRAGKQSAERGLHACAFSAGTEGLSFLAPAGFAWPPTLQRLLKRFPISPSALRVANLRAGSCSVLTAIAAGQGVRSGRTTAAARSAPPLVVSRLRSSLLAGHLVLSGMGSILVRTADLGTSERHGLPSHTTA